MTYNTMEEARDAAVVELGGESGVHLDDLDPLILSRVKRSVKEMVIIPAAEISSQSNIEAMERDLEQMVGFQFDKGGKLESFVVYPVKDGYSFCAVI